MNKSAAVRKALKTLSKPTEISAALKKKGIDVSRQFVSAVKSQHKKRQIDPPLKPGRPQGATKEVIDGRRKAELLAATNLVSQAVDFVAQCGGEAEAKSLVEEAARMLRKIQRAR